MRHPRNLSRPHRRGPGHLWAAARAAALCGLVLGSLAAVGAPRLTQSAAAAVVHERGFEGSVAGFASWYGSYGMGSIGTAWCVDHGIAAPDPAYDYEPAALSDRAVDTRTALAWVLAVHGPDAGAVDAAALELVLHDLMGASYPTGRLDVGRLRPSDLHGFGGHAPEVLERATQWKQEAQARGALRGPLVLEASGATVAAGAVATVTARIHDVTGAGVGGLAVTIGDAVATTGPDGAVAVGFPADAGTHAVRVAAEVPDLALASFAPRLHLAQRVARPARRPLTATAAVKGIPNHSLVVHKTGDDQAYLPVGGAGFDLVPSGSASVVGHLVAAADGTTPALTVAAGHYQLREVAPPAGYEPSSPVEVDLTDGDAHVEVADHAVPGSLTIEKADAATGTLVAGATVDLGYDAAHDGTFRPVTTLTTGAVPPSPLLHLAPGDYRVVERAAPPGYLGDPTPVLVHLPAGGAVTVRLNDRGVATVVFHKRPAVAGATFAVTGHPPQPPPAPPVSHADATGDDSVRIRPDGEPPVQPIELGRCTTDAAGRCSLPPGVVAARATVCWHEVAAPVGFDAAAPACLTTGPPGASSVVEVDEPRSATPPATPVVLAAPPQLRTPAVPAGPTAPAPVGMLPATGPATVELEALAGGASTTVGWALVLAGGRTRRRTRRRLRRPSETRAAEGRRRRHQHGVGQGQGAGRVLDDAPSAAESGGLHPAQPT